MHIKTFQDISSTLTKTCQTFSLAPSKLQKRMLTPTSPWPPHMLLGMMVVSLTASVLLLYNSILMGLSTFIFSNSFRLSSSLFYQRSKHSNNQSEHEQDYMRRTNPGQIATASSVIVVNVNLPV